MDNRIDLDLYQVVYEKAGINYSCYSKVLPGCTSAGSTLILCKEHMQDAIEIHLSGLRDDGIEVKIDPKGNVFWHNKKGLHRDNDLPAIEWRDGVRKEWYKNGLLHRVSGYALIDINGNKEWYRKGMLHRDNDLPAIEKISGVKFWYKHGIKHRDIGPAVVYKNVAKEFWINGVRVESSKDY